MEVDADKGIVKIIKKVQNKIMAEGNYYEGFLSAASVEVKQWIFRREEVKNILDFVGDEKSKILDIGSNLGYLDKKISEKNGSSVVGIDTNSSNLVYKFAKKRTSKQEANFLQASGTETPFKDASFDKVILSHVLEHFEDPKQLLDEIKRVLISGGELIVAVPKEKQLGQFSKDHKLLFDSVERLSEILEENGFKALEFSELERSIVLKAKKTEKQDL